MVCRYAMATFIRRVPSRNSQRYDGITLPPYFIFYANNLSAIGEIGEVCSGYCIGVCAMMKKASPINEEDEPLRPRQFSASASVHLEDVYDAEDTHDATSHPFHTNLGDGSPRPSRSSHGSSRHSAGARSSGGMPKSLLAKEPADAPSDVDITWIEPDEANTCFYNLCRKKTRNLYCCKYTGFEFYNQNHYLLYCSVAWMLLALLVAVVVPLVSRPPLVFFLSLQRRLSD